METKQPITNKKVHYKEYGITTEQSIIYIDKQNIVMGIFKDITKEEREQENLYDLRVETMEMAQKVIDKQMVAAQRKPVRRDHCGNQGDPDQAKKYDCV